MISRNDSPSSCSPSAVEPLTSAKTAVTVLRTSCVASSAPRGVPHMPQSRKPGGFSCPQFPQTATHEAYDEKGATPRLSTFRPAPDQSVMKLGGSSTSEPTAAYARRRGAPRPVAP